MPDRFGLDIDGDGLIDEPDPVVPESWRVDFDAGASTGDIVTYEWRADGAIGDDTAQSAAATGVSFEFPAEGTYAVTLTVTDPGGATESVTLDVVVQDWVIVGMGDSYASGEGVPDIPIPPDAFVDVDDVLEVLEDAIAARDAAKATLDATKATLDAAQAALQNAQAVLAAKVAESVNVQNKLQAVANARAALTAAQIARNAARAVRNARCTTFPFTGCAAAQADLVAKQAAVAAKQGALAAARAKLLVALAVLGLDTLINDPGAIVQALSGLVGVAEAARDTALAARDSALAARDLALSTWEFAEAVLQSAQSALQIRNGELAGTWRDARCNRSIFSGQAQAALRIEQADPRTSVTFIHLACSGATITAGIAGGYGGQNPPPDSDPLPPQVDVARNLLDLDEDGMADREVDAIIVSIGGNDINFASLITKCIETEPCFATLDPDPVIAELSEAICTPLRRLSIDPAFYPPGHPVSLCLAFFDELPRDFFGKLPVGGAPEIFDMGLNGDPNDPDCQDPDPDAPLTVAFGCESLSDKYDAMHHRVAAMFPVLPAARVYLTEYPDATKDDAGNHCGFALFDPLAKKLANLPGVTMSEIAWADGIVQTQLNQAMMDAASLHGWTFVAGMLDDFVTHGYCADDHWLVRLTETFQIQGSITGVMHPSGVGQLTYADRIEAALNRDFYGNDEGDISSPRPPRNFVPGGDDSDGDGVPDDLDQCPATDRSPTVVFGTCDSGVENSIVDGCSIADRIAEIAGMPNDDDDSVRRGTIQLAQSLVRDGTVSHPQQAAIVRCVTGGDPASRLLRDLHSGGG